MKKNCKYCKKEYIKKRNESRNTWSTRLYCSHSCSSKVNSDPKRLLQWIKVNRSWCLGKKLGKSPRNTRIELSCLNCKSNFSVRNYRKLEAKFCSRPCAYQYNNHGKTSKNEKIRKSKEYALWRYSVFFRDNFTCQKCGIKNKNGLGKTIELHVDHIKPFSQFPELRLALDNGRTLCTNCHKQTETYGFKAWRIPQQA